MSDRPRLIGINHVALEVGSIDEALAFYGRYFSFELRGRSETMAFLDMGDQFLALSAPRCQPPDEHRHFGLVVENREGLRDRLEQDGVPLVDDRRLDFLDPWGNRIEVVDYRDIQFLKDPRVLHSLGLGGLGKSDGAREELAEKGVEVTDEFQHREA